MPKDNEGEEFQVKITTIYGPNSGHQNTFLGEKQQSLLFFAHKTNTSLVAHLSKHSLRNVTFN